MQRIQLIETLIAMLLDEMPQYKDNASQFGEGLNSRRRLLRSLMNVRPPKPLKQDFLTLQDQLLSAETAEKGVVDVNTLPETRTPGIVLWRGDITHLNADAIVNAANSALLGCFYPCHGCIDNAIHSAAGLQLREECRRIMEEQGHEEPAGLAKVTGAYNLPSRYVVHTVGPIVRGVLKPEDCEQLAECYRSCFQAVLNMGLKSIAFCCISTGEFHFPADQAAAIAADTIKGCMSDIPNEMKVIFNVFKESDETLYRRILGADLRTE